MAKRIIITVIAASLVFVLASCGAKTVKCDHCKEDIKVSADSNITDDWIMYCKDCNESLKIEEEIINSLK